jgi:hypothetical protein
MKLCVSPAIICLLVITAAHVCPAIIIFDEQTVDNAAHGNGCLYACDIDNDGDTDLLGALIEDNDIIWWRNDGGSPLTWTKLYVDWNFSGARSVYAADIDSDGDLDVIGAAYNIGQIAWWENTGPDPADWNKQVITYTYTLPHEVFAYDVDNDGHTDILGASSELDQVSWWRNDGGYPIVWTEQTIGSGFGMAKSVCAADIDGDGIPDVIGAALEIGRVSWWHNDGGDTIHWTEHIIDSTFWGAHRVQAIDLDFDGDIDVVGAAYLRHEIAWWRNDGGDPIHWTKQTVGTGLTNACVAVAGDIDGDGDIDIAGSAQGTNELAWWRNDGGDPIHWEKFTIANFYRVWPVAIGDFDGDSRNDIAAGSSHNGTNEVLWWRNVGETAIDDNQPDLPNRTGLLDTYPNPFNARTTISFTLAKPSPVTVDIYDITGRLICCLADGYFSIGRHSINWSSADISSGIYFIRLQTDKSVDTKNVILLK